MVKIQFRGLKALFMGALVAGMATVAVSGWAHSAHGNGHGGRHGPMGGPGMFLMGPPERIDRAVDRMLNGVDVTDVQRKQVKEIAHAAARDMRAQAESGRELHERMRALLVAPAIDETAIEALRQQAASQHETVSRRVTQAIVDAAKVLTPKQREQLAKRFEKRHDHMMPREQSALPSTIPMT